jgi:hypothetical protein
MKSLNLVFYPDLSVKLINIDLDNYIPEPDLINMLSNFFDSHDLNSVSSSKDLENLRIILINYIYKKYPGTKLCLSKNHKDHEDHNYDLKFRYLKLVSIESDDRSFVYYV